MKYAVLNGERIEPQKGIKNAICPICGEYVVPKCGKIKIHHWAHTSNTNCDPWWKSETEWHRKWKDNFPKECQEVIMHDNKTGDKHVADVKTKTDIVLEFQHSPMNIEEQQSREQFYKNMVWIVDARKYYHKFKQYIKLLNHCKCNNSCYYIKKDSFETKNFCFPKRWLNSSVPVIFDFGVHDNIENNDYSTQKKWLWCVFPEEFSILFYEVTCGMCLKKQSLINRVSNFDSFYPNIVIPELEKLKIELEGEEKNENEQWNEAIYNLRLNIKNKNINPKKLYISNEGKILDSNKHNYSGKKCIILGINENNIKYNALMLIKLDNQFVTATIDIFSPNLVNYHTDYLSSKNYYDIEILNVISICNKYYLSCAHNKRIFTTKKIMNALDFICNNFK